MKIKLNKHNRCHYKLTQYGWTAKTQYNSMYEANIVCSKINSSQAIEFKVIPYICNICNNIHIGKDKTVFNDLNNTILKRVEIYR